jgi:hypothetical protein
MRLGRVATMQRLNESVSRAPFVGLAIVVALGAGYVASIIHLLEEHRAHPDDIPAGSADRSGRPGEPRRGKDERDGCDLRYQTFSDDKTRRRTSGG